MAVDAQTLEEPTAGRGSYLPLLILTVVILMRMPNAKPTSDTRRILVVGGEIRKAGKTSVVESILHAFPKYHWTAVKISPHVHDSPAGGKLLVRGAIVRQSMGQGPGVAPADFRLWEEIASNSANDTGRFLAAGAARALLLEADDGQLPDAVAKLLEFLPNERAGWIICETTRAAPLLGARLFLMVTGQDARAAKASAQRMWPLADAIVVCAPIDDSAAVSGVVMPGSMLDDNRNMGRREGKRDNLMPGPVFRIEERGALPTDLRSFIERRFLRQASQS
jgi:hypothetical protein